TPMILDLRPHSELEQNPSQIRGALHMTMDEVERRQQELPRDRDIILYCSCPNEVSSARVALLLHRKGFSRVRPLLGGIDAWRERNYPLELKALRVQSPLGVASVTQEAPPIKPASIQIVLTDENQSIQTQEGESR